MLLACEFSKYMFLFLMRVMFEFSMMSSVSCRIWLVRRGPDDMSHPMYHNPKPQNPNKELT